MPSHRVVPDKVQRAVKWLCVIVVIVCQQILAFVCVRFHRPNSNSWKTAHVGSSVSVALTAIRRNYVLISDVFSGLKRPTSVVCWSVSFVAPAAAACLIIGKPSSQTNDILL